MLTIYRRHLKDCEHRDEGRAYRRCKCPIWVDGLLGGEEIRESLKLRDWEKANTKIHEWEERGSKEEPEEEPKKEPTTIVEASEKFLEDARSRELADATLYKYRLLFRQLETFASKEGLRYLAELDLEMLRKFRAGWTERNLTSRNKLERLRTFLRFCVDSEWIAKNHALKLKTPKVTEPPTLPLTRDEVVQILAACPDYPDKLNRVRLKALVLLLRYSGLRIRDAVTLSRDRISEDKLFLRTMKTGTVVWCPLPPSVIEALKSIPSAGQHFFWSGEGKAKSCASSYQRALHRLFMLAGVPEARPHRFRDTFAVEMLLAGVPLERVSVLLGHQSLKVTEKHYAPWVKARQDQLEADVRRNWDSDQISVGESERRVHAGYTAQTAKPN